jgi:hypothetical protein
MKIDLQKALDATESTYYELVAIANNIAKDYVSDVNALVADAYDNVDNLTNEALRGLITRISLKSFDLGDVKEKSGLKAECAEALRKEAYAIAFNGADGSVAAKDNSATLSTSSEILVGKIYEVVAALLKTKLDECHRVVAALTTVLTSRMAEAKAKADLQKGAM